MKIFLATLKFGFADLVCSAFLAFVASRIAQSWRVAGMFALDPVQFRRYWIYFFVLIFAGAWIVIFPPVRR